MGLHCYLFFHVVPWFFWQSWNIETRLLLLLFLFLLSMKESLSSQQSLALSALSWTPWRNCWRKARLPSALSPWRMWEDNLGAHPVIYTSMCIIYRIVLLSWSWLYWNIQASFIHSVQFLVSISNYFHYYRLVANILHRILQKINIKKRLQGFVVSERN